MFSAMNFVKSKKFLILIPLLLGVMIGQTIGLDHSRKMTDSQELSVNVYTDYPFDLQLTSFLTELNIWDDVWFDNLASLTFTNPGDSGMSIAVNMWVMIQAEGINATDLEMRADTWTTESGGWTMDREMNFTQIDANTIEAGIGALIEERILPDGTGQYIFDIHIFNGVLDDGPPLGLWNFTFWAERQ